MEAINKAFLQIQNQQTAFAAIKGITPDMLTAHNPNRNQSAIITVLLPSLSYSSDA